MTPCRLVARVAVAAVALLSPLAARASDGRGADSVIAAATGDTIVIDLAHRGADVSPTMYGVFFEEINHAGDGGLYGELVANRSFEDGLLPDGFCVAEGGGSVAVAGRNHLTGEATRRDFPWPTDDVPGWRLVTADSRAARMTVTTDRPAFATAPRNLRLDLAAGDAPVALVNDGYWGIGIAGGEEYRLRVIARTDGLYRGTLRARLVAAAGRDLAAVALPLAAEGWGDTTVTLTACAADTAASLVLDFDGEGTIWLDFVSLFPRHTFRDRPNGMRRDVAQLIAALRPAFFRWPGGCVVEGITMATRYDWRKTLGDVAARSGEYVQWGYRTTYGMGWHEVLQFCEDIGAAAMYVCNAGIACQMRLGDACPDDSVAALIDDCLAAIEYALGDTTTYWGARRAAAGHAAPFPLRYVEVGNENWGETYNRRFPRFRDAIKARWPDVAVIYNVMWKPDSGPVPETDMADPHWYVAPDAFFRSHDTFDRWPRANHTLYVGEYACNKGVGSGNMYAALSEAAFVGGMERNGDLVRMASYAPLLENVNDRRWPVNLIRISAAGAYGRSSYHVQKMAAAHRPDYNVFVSLVADSVRRGTSGGDDTAWPRCPLQFVGAGYDTTVSELVLKVVNAASVPYVKEFRIDGAAAVGTSGRVVTLAAHSGTDENTPADPQRIAPVESVADGFGTTFRYAFAPFSYTILRVRASVAPR